MDNSFRKIQLGQAPDKGAGSGGMTMLNGETQVFVIIGDPIAQVKSPSFLTKILADRGFNGVVIPGHVSQAALADCMTGLMKMQNLGGIIATVPHKQAMSAYCNHVTERAEFAGSVNVLWREGDGWAGDNTDGMGYLDGIKAAGASVKDKRVLLVGAGGAGSAIAYEFLARGAAHLAIHDIDTGRRENLIARLNTRFPGRLAVGSSDPTGFDIVGNATPLGMQKNDPLPVEVRKLSGAEFVADVITKPEISPLLVAARERGCGTMPGLGMFKAQEGLLVDALLRSIRN